MADTMETEVADGGRKMKGRGHRDPTSLEDRYKNVRFTELEGSGTGPGPTRSVEGWVVFVTGINEEAQEEDLHDAFAEFGNIKSFHMNLDRQTVR
jgi:RNA-binding protein 8A